MLQKYLYACLFLQSFWYFAFLESSFVFLENNSYAKVHRDYKKYCQNIDYLTIVLYFGEKIDASDSCYKEKRETFFDMNHKMKQIIQRRDLLKRLYIESHQDVTSLLKLEHYLQEDLPNLLEMLDQLIEFKDKCN